MFRHALLPVATAGTLVLLIVALLVHATWLIGVAALALGVTALVFSRELSEQAGTGAYALPGSRGTRQVLLTVCGLVLAALGGFVFISALG